MSAFFVISGLFVWRSLEKGGAVKFLLKRLLRLVLPFLIGYLIINVVAYYLSYLSYMNAVGEQAVSYMSYWQYVISSGFTTIGPFWFIGLLFIFNCILVIVYKIFPNLGNTIRLKGAGFFERPWLFILVFFVLSLASYLSLAIPFGSFSWTGFGPIVFQTGRVAHYFVYFIMGTLIGIYGIERSVFKKAGSIAKRWWIWLLIGLLIFIVVYTIALTTSLDIDFLTTVFFAFVCMPMTFACIGFFVRYIKKENKVLKSLSNNAYGIYVVHYPVVTGLQFLLLSASFFGGLKALVVSIVGLAICWVLVWALRRIPIVRKVI